MAWEFSYYLEWDYSGIKKVNTPSRVPQILENGAVQQSHGPLVNDRPLILHERFCEMFNSKNLRKKRISRALFLQELLDILEERNSTTPVENKEESIAEKLKDFLDEFARLPFSSAGSVKDEIRKMGKSYFHQERIFKKIFGVSPYQYVNSLRVERIKSQLLETELGISEIAYKMGYDDIAYFSRFFSQRTGKSPREFRSAALNK